MTCEQNIANYLIQAPMKTIFFLDFDSLKASPMTMY